MSLYEGDVFYKCCDSLSRMNKCHVINTIHDDDRILIVYKWHGRYKQWWHYEIEDEMLLDRHTKILKKNNKGERL